MELGEKSISISTGTMVRAVIVGLIFVSLFILKDIVLVLLVSIVVASAIEPATQWFVRRNIPRLFSVIFIYVLIALSLVGIFFFLIIPLLSDSTDFIKSSPNYFNPNTISTSLLHSDFFSSQNFVTDITNSLNIDQIALKINDVISGIYLDMFGTITKIFGGLMNFFLILIISFYLAVEEDGVGKFLKAITTIRHEKYAISLWKRSQRKIGLWMQGQLVLAVIIGTLVYLGLLIINLPNALLLATLAAVFEIIPLFGPILASIPAIIIAFVTGGFSQGLVVFGLYIIVHQFENQLIYPLVVKKVVGVSPIVSIVALTVGFQLAGFIGLILSVPMAAVIIEFVSDFERDKIDKVERMNPKD